MARDQESKAICSHGPSDRTGSLGSPDRAGQLPVGQSDRIGTAAQIFPDRELERRPDRENWNRRGIFKTLRDHFLDLRRVAQVRLGPLGLQGGDALLPTLHEAKRQQMISSGQSDAVAEGGAGDAVEQFFLRAEGADPSIMW